MRETADARNYDGPSPQTAKTVGFHNQEEHDRDAKSCAPDRSPSQWTGGRTTSGGYWLSGSGSSTKSGAEVLPTTEAEPPMMIMNSSRSERSRLKAAGSQAPRWTKLANAPPRRR